jgi:hypothetical protein
VSGDWAPGLWAYNFAGLRFMSKGDRRSLERLLRSAWERQIVLQTGISMTSASGPSKKPRMRLDVTLTLLGLGIGIVIVLVPPTTPVGAACCLVTLFLVLIYPALHLTEWILRSPGGMSRILAIVFLGVAVTAFGFRVWPHQGRWLTKAQINGLGRLADSRPPNIKIMVRVAGNSPEARRYGKQIWDVLYAHKATGPFIIAAAEEPPSGLEVLVTSEIGEAGQAGERFMDGLDDLGMPCLIHEGYWAADDRSFVLFVGVSPNHN